MLTKKDEYLQKLKQIQDSYSPNLVMVPDDEPRFIIDANKRIISIPDEFSFLAVLKDTRAETIYFEIDRYFDEHDLSEKICVVQYACQDDEGNDISGIYPVTDIDTESVDGKIVFGWTITNEVTSVAGDIQFAIRFYTIKTDEEENPYFDFCFNTLTSELPVMNTLDVMETISESVDPSILDEWNFRMQELYSKTNDVVNKFGEDVDSAKEDIQKTGQTSIEEIKEAVSSEKQSAIDSIVKASNAEQEKIHNILPEIGEDDNGKMLGVLDGEFALMSNPSGMETGNGLLYDEETNTISVDVENDVIEDSDKPISSAAVFRSIGNIGAILSSI